MSVAVISGTTSGLGRQYVDAILDECPEVTEIWMIARRKAVMARIANEYPNMKFKLLGLDLADQTSYSELAKVLREFQPKIEAVVSNAGVAYSQNVIDEPLQEIETMIKLNVIGATALIRLCLPYINSDGFILSVASTSSFVPHPHMSVYSSTKAYLKSFSLGLREELRDRKIKVCVVFPGRMKTEMDARLNQGERLGAINKVPVVDTKKFAYRTIRAARNGRATYTMLPFYKAFRVMASLVPQSIIVRFTKI